MSFCQSDVKLLAEGCLSFRSIIKELTTNSSGKYIDPFNGPVTLASLCHLIYRSQIMKTKTIAYIPENGYNPETTSSFKACQWLFYCSKKYNIIIRDSRNGGEVNCGGYKIDGFSEVENKYFEFHGCFFHGCPKCFNPETFNPFLNLTMGTIFERHKKRIEYIKSINSNLEEIWECEWDILLKENKVINEIVDLFEYKPPLNPRNCLYGGRTNPVKLYYKCVLGEKIGYDDIISLYPFVQKYCIYPIGHPIIEKDNFGDIMTYFGVIKCLILPPKGLFFPILPMKIGGKSVFTLCFKCAEFKIEKCCHNENERALNGDWVLLEVQEAIKRGYRILKIYEIWHWKTTAKYDEATNSSGAFEDYVNLFLKGKTESSGYPIWVKSEEDKDEYIRKFEENEGILLEKEKIIKINGKRFVYKLHLNSFLGRFGLNPDKTHYKIITDPNEWFDMMNNDQFIINLVDFSNDNCIQVFYKNRFIETNIDTNVILASFVTAHARLKLYS